jgi:hypothetical protein
VRGIHFGATENLHHITCFIGDGLWASGGTHLRTLGIDKDTNVVAHATHIINYVFNTLFIGMRRVHSHYIHACLEETADEILITSSVTNASYNFCLLHVIFPSFCGAKIQKNGQKAVIFVFF